MLKETDGFDIVINGINRTFRDVHLTAIETGIVFKMRNPADDVQIRERATGQLTTILPDGRTG